MNYQCCYCKKEFPASEAIDGFSKGYKVGFLCPECGENIQDTPLNEEWAFSSKSSQLFFVVVILYILLAWGILNALEPNSLSHYLVALGGLVPFFIYGHINHPRDMYSPTIVTKPVKK